MWKDTLNFAGEHYFLAAFLAFLTYHFMIYPLRLINRWIRHRNIVARGWPTNPQMDADGDIIQKEEADA